jgi:hypothetical protein
MLRVHFRFVEKYFEFGHPITAVISSTLRLNYVVSADFFFLSAKKEVHLSFSLFLKARDFRVCSNRQVEWKEG